MKNFLSKFIVDRKIVVISDHKVKSVRISAKLQYAALAVIVAAAAWLPFSLGRAAAYQDISYENAMMIDSGGDIDKRLYLMEKNVRVLEHYLSKLYKDGKFFVSQEDEEAKNTSEKLKDLEIRKNKIAAYLTNFTETKTKQIEDVLTESGVNYVAILAHQNKLASNRSLGQGGPYVPVGVGRTAVESINAYTDYFNDSFVEDFEYLVSLQDIVADMPFSSPVQTPRVSSGFGYRRDPYKRNFAMHSGIDLVGKENATVHVTAPGVVKKVSHRGAYGNLIVVQHANGVTTRYAHLKKIYVTPGQKLGRGNVIGIQGSTGRSTGAHLHYEVRINGKPVNPMRFLRYADKINYYEVKI